jgi:ATP-dependent DNA helicase RecG
MTRPASDLNTVKTYAETLRTRIFPDLRVGLLHGKLKAAQKHAVMKSFAKELWMCWWPPPSSEVGMDVPNAALMVVEKRRAVRTFPAHQLRGRVGEAGTIVCILVSAAKPPRVWPGCGLASTTTASKSRKRI